MTESEEVRDQVARALSFRESGRVKDSANTFARIFQRFGASTDPAVRTGVAEALVNLGAMVRSSGDATGAIGIFEKVIADYGTATVFFICALYNKASALMALGRLDEAIASYEQILTAARGHADDDPAVPQSVAGALLNLGVLRARTDAPDQALAACDEAVRRFGRDPDPHLQGLAANALHNKAMTLKNNSRHSEAIATLTELVERFHAVASEEARRWAGIAQYSKSIHLGTMGQAQASVAAAEEMVRRFGDSSDPAIRERLAKALYHRALIARATGHVVDAVHFCRDIQARFDGDTNSAVQAVIAAARRHEYFVVASAAPSFDSATSSLELDPTMRAAYRNSGNVFAGSINVIWDGENQGGKPPEPFTLTQALQILATPKSSPAEGADRESRNRAFVRNMFRDDLARDLESHLSAAKILADYLDERAPFGLFLRNFDTEGSTVAGSGAPEPIRVSIQLLKESPVETKVAATLGAKVPLVGVGNNAPVRLDFHRQLPRLLLPNNHWQEVVEELIGASAIIVLDVIRLTPGVLWELTTIQRLNRQNETVVILSPPHAVEAAASEVEEIYGVKTKASPLAQLQSSQFTGFARVLQLSTLTRRVVDMPQFSDLVATVERVQSSKPEERDLWEGFTF